jgi:tetratricopeptide (TPR) repeat protein
MATTANRGRPWWIPIVLGFVVALLVNLPMLLGFLPEGALPELLRGEVVSSLETVFSSSLAQIGGNGVAILLAGWGVVLLLRGTSPQLDMARKLERNGDLSGAAELQLQAGNHQRALSLLTKARAWKKAAEVALGSGLKQEAAAFLRRAGGINLAEAAELYRQIGDSKGARRCDLDLAEWHIQEGRIDEAIAAWLRGGEKKRALRAVRLAIKQGKLRPTNPVFSAVREAAKEFEEHQLIALILELEESWEDAAHAWRLAGEHVRAAECFRRADRIEEAAIEESMAGRSKQAIRLQLQQLARLKDQVAAAKIRAGASGTETIRLQEQVDATTDELIPKLRQLDLRSELVQVLKTSGRIEEAVEELVNANQLGRAAELAHAEQRWDLSAPLLERLSRWSEASDDYELARKPEQAAHCAELAGEFERALKIYQKLGKVGSTAGCLARLGRLQDGLQMLHRQGRLKDACDLLRSSPGPVPDSPDLVLDLAAWLRENASLKEAIACLQRAVLGVALQPIRVDPAVALASYLFDAGDYDAAQEHVDRILAFDYSNEAAQELKQKIKGIQQSPAITQAAAPVDTNADTFSGEVTPQLSVVAEQRYEIGDLLGRGGMGVVYLARDTRLERQVAVKVLRTTSPEEAARLEREAKVAATLNHPGIVTIHDFEVGFGGYFIVMEYVPGDALDKLLRSNRRRISDNLLPLLTDLIGTVAYAHERDVVHRDLKPANVLLTPDNEVKILDFGIAARLNIESDTGTGVCGTPYYMSPEQIRGEAPTRASDIYSFGATAFHLATGRPPFQRGNVIDAHLEKDPPDPMELEPTLIPELSQCILRCLNKEPDDRYSSAADLHEELSRLGKAMIW